MKRLLFVQPSLQPPGGGNGVAAWLLEALKHDYAITILGWRPLDLEAINRHYGTALRAEELGWLSVADPLHRLLDAIPLPLSLLRTNLMLRLCKRIAADYDLVMTANNEADFGRPGIQYVHYPWMFQPRPPVDLRWYHGSNAIVDAYYRFCVGLSRYSQASVVENLTLVNSNWTGARYRDLYGAASTTLHPPVVGDFASVPWAARENGFVCVGRIAPEKELDKVIDIVAALRERGHELHLHLIGVDDDPPYYRHVRGRAAASGGWVHLEENLPRAQLVDLLARHRYGIHGMTEEHFGIAVGEMIRAGCVVFVPNGGGQREVVGEPQLLYDSAADAVEKIGAVLGAADAQQRLRQSLAGRADALSVEHFTERVREIARAFTAASPSR